MVTESNLIEIKTRVTFENLRNCVGVRIRQVDRYTTRVALVIVKIVVDKGSFPKALVGNEFAFGYVS